MRCVSVAALVAVALPFVPANAAASAGRPLSIEQERRYFTEDAVAPMVKPPNYDVTIVALLLSQRLDHPTD